MFDVYYYDSIDSETPRLLHSSLSNGNNILSGVIKEELNTVSTFNFSISSSNSLFRQIDPFKGIVQVVNPIDGEEVFFGRILKPTTSMSSKGTFTQSFIAESPLSFLHDSSQRYRRYPTYLGERDMVHEILSEHNRRVEPGKEFVTGNIDVIDNNPPDITYIAFESSFDAMTKRLERLGGYVKVSRDSGRWRLDWTREVGEEKTTPIKLGINLKSASRSNEFEGIATRFIPLGHEVGEFWGDEGAIRERFKLSDTEGFDVDYIQDDELVERFGIIEKTEIYDDVKTKDALLDKAYAFFQKQLKYLTSWQIDLVDLSYIDPTKERFVVGDYYPVDSPPMSDIEMVQITSKETDIMKPHAIKVTIGAFNNAISRYYTETKRRGS